LHRKIAIRGFSISSQQLSERDALLSTSSVEGITPAYFVRSTGTLLIAVEETELSSFHLLALSEENDKWLQRDSLEVAEAIWDTCALDDNRVICRSGSSITLRVFGVTASHRIQPLAEHLLPEWCRSISSRSTTPHPLLAVAFRKSVSLFAVRPENRLEELSTIQMQFPSRLLFVGDSLLVAEWNWKSDVDSVSALRTTGGELERQRELIAESEGIHVDYWFLVGDGLALWNGRENKLRLYSLVFDD
jgi:hypothetical protein